MPANHRRHTILLSLTAFVSALIFTSTFYFVNKQNFIKVQASNDAEVHAVVPNYEPVGYIFDDDPGSGLSIQKVFDGVLDASDDAVVLLSTGDVAPARAVNSLAIQKNDFTWPYLKIAVELSEADITVINLESPLFSGCVMTLQGMQFCGDQRHVEGLIYSGVDIVSLANEHILNYGVKGLSNTINLLAKAGIQQVGAGNAVVKDVQGVKFGFLSYTDVGAKEKSIRWAEPEVMKRDVAALDAKVDVVVVSMHWGIEYVQSPSKQQVELAHELVDSGADLVLGNHPHVIEPVEVYKGKLIVYSHGNFVSDQMWSDMTREGVVGRYYFDNETLVDAEFLPTVIEDYGQPVFVEGLKKDLILQEMKYESLNP